MLTTSGEFVNECAELVSNSSAIIAPSKSIVCTPVFCPANDTPSPTPAELKQLRCQQQAKDFQTKYNKAQRLKYAGNILGGGAGAKLGWQAFFFGFIWGAEMNHAQSDAAYTIGYRSCMAGGI